MGFMNQLIEKQCAVLAECFMDLLGFGRQFADRRLFGQAAPQSDLTARQQQNRRAAQCGAGATRNDRRWRELRAIEIELVERAVQPRTREADPRRDAVVSQAVETADILKVAGVQ